MKLREHRKRAKLTQKRLGELVFQSAGQSKKKVTVLQKIVSNWETGVQSPSDDLIPHICGALKIERGELDIGSGPSPSDEVYKTVISLLRDGELPPDMLHLVQENQALQHALVAALIRETRRLCEKMQQALTEN